ncbi:flagellar assembly protein FliH [Asticcacaulis machinosus]|uniref:Flagellar assembly protein FliH n=1 Tax=Asticcacaulis machinosus TaxID=2984211 RepID=A0ABT5HJ38_9CAUL|nr:flagellar assembly protein FliH [Asticcacaulis machinosus]MDC7676243.1 flagellar assembly protein FliH [Asticcacaulis machinosus]
MTQPVHKKFEFGTVFGDAGQVTRASAQKRSYTPEEVETLRTNAYHDGEQSALARAQLAQAQALQALADNAHLGLSSLHEAISAHKAACAQLALICAQKIAAEALNRFPEEPLKATLQALTHEIDTAPRLIVTVANPDAALQGAAREAVALAGFTGAISFRSNAAMSAGAFEVMWPDGRAEFDPERVLNALDTALHEALAADHHHHQAAAAVKREA